MVIRSSEFLAAFILQFLVPACQVSFMTIRSFLLPTYSRWSVTPSRGLVTITVSKACSRPITQSQSFTGDGVWCSDPFDRPRRQPPRPGSRPQHGHGGLGHGTLGLEMPLAQSSAWAWRTGSWHAGTGGASSPVLRMGMEDWVMARWDWRCL